MHHHSSALSGKNFGDSFFWGVAMSAAQNEGAWNVDGRGASIWDVFSKRTGKIAGSAKPSVATDFYFRYRDDLFLAKAMGFNSFRFSISWSRIFPEGTGKPNKAGVAFYHRLIDECIALGLTPFVTLYHWDLPQVLEKEGGWASHHMDHWFNRYVLYCAKEFGDKVKHWIVLNEPFGFTALGYMLGKHAPGKTNLHLFLKSVHHAAIAQADGGRILRAEVKNAHIGTSFSCSEVIPFSESAEDKAAAYRVDVLLNRLFIEPLLGKGYPHHQFDLMDKLELVNTAWKYTDRLQFDMDFIGLQNYFPVVVRHNSFIPYIQASEVKPVKRKVPVTAMGWEINADSFYNIIKRFWKYGGVKAIMITENGAAFKDKLKEGIIDDAERISYFNDYLHALHKVKKDGVKVTGYFAWTLTDNFEWAEGYRSRFGLVHVDFQTQLRTIKNSGYWFRDFLKK